MKYLKVTFENGEAYEIPLDVIAKNRTDHYASKEEDDFNYEEEMDFVMEDDYEGIDWASNNMDWKDVEKHAKKVGKKNIEKDWCNAEKEIIEK